MKGEKIHFDSWFQMFPTLGEANIVAEGHGQEKGSLLGSQEAEGGRKEPEIRFVFPGHNPAT